MGEEKKDHVILREKDSGKFYQSFLIGIVESIDEETGTLSISRTLRYVQDIQGKVSKYSENGQPEKVDYGFSGLILPDIVMTNIEGLKVNMSDFLYCLVVRHDEKHELVDTYMTQMTAIRAQEAGLHLPKEKGIVKPNLEVSN